MTLNLDSVGMTGPAVEHSWKASDVMLYALAVGAGQADPAAELTVEEARLESERGR